MPGMMDTILNVGIDESNLDAWKQRIGERTALDSYRRFLQMYGATALGLPMEEFENALSEIRMAAKVTTDAELEPAYLLRLIKRYKDIYAAHSETVPDAASALVRSVGAVFDSWMTPRAIAYRKDNNIPEDWGTAVNIQAMVFGNADDKSCSGVAFTRDRDSGINTPMGDYLVNAQGEDVVAGIRPTEPLHKMQKWNPKVYEELNGLMIKLESHFKDMQDIEFTVQFGKLWMLQTRTAKRAAAAAFQVALDMMNEGLITKDEAMKRISGQQLLEMFKPVIDPSFKGKPIATGFAAGGRVVTGEACFNSDSAINGKSKGMSVILVRKETDPNDYEGIMASAGVLTSTGGSTSHAAVVARGKDKTCVVGCTALTIQGAYAYIDNDGEPKKAFKHGDIISIDGDTGNVYLGNVPVKEPVITDAVRTVAAWFSNGDTAHRITGRSTPYIAAQLLDGSGEVAYVDTCTLGDGHNLADLEGAITGSKFKTVVLDLSDVDHYYDVKDKVFNKMFGWDPNSGTANSKASQLLAFSQATASKTIVKLPKGCTMADKLRKMGFKVIGAVNTVADLLDSGGAITIDEETILKVFGTKEAFQFVQEALVKSGKATQAQPVPQPAYWYEPLLRKGN
jgi:pyruvate,orthophosphate dikinase